MRPLANYVQNSKFDELEKKRLKQNMEKALAESPPYLLQKLAIYEKVVQDAQFLGNQSRSGRNGLSTIKRLHYHTAKALDSGKLARVFKLNDDDTKDSLADQVSEEFKLYQLQKIPSFTKAKREDKREVVLLKVCI